MMPLQLTNKTNRQRSIQPRAKCRRTAPSVSRHTLQLESLEQRQLLAANLMINEFLARNDGGLRDGTGRASDWIEVFNAGDESVNLKGYHLTDNHDALTKWTFPPKLGRSA